MSLRTTKRISSEVMREKYFPEYNPDDEFRPIKWKHFMKPVTKYKISRSGIVVGPKGIPLKWMAKNADRGENSTPQVGIYVDKDELYTDRTKKDLQIHRGVAFSYYDELQWEMGEDFLEKFEVADPLIQKILIDEVFQVDHHNGVRWDTHISNLRLMLPGDNRKKSIPKNIKASRDRIEQLALQGVSGNESY